VADSEGNEACVVTWMGRDEKAVRGRRTEPIPGANGASGCDFAECEVPNAGSGLIRLSYWQLCDHFAYDIFSMAVTLARSSGRQIW
jgi:hypothetical protein